MLKMLKQTCWLALHKMPQISIVHFPRRLPEALAPKPLLARKQRLLHLEAETKLTVPMSVESNAWREKVWTGTVWNRHQLLQISANASDFNSRLGLFWTFFPQDAVWKNMEKYGKHETGQKATWHGLSRAAVADDVGLKLKVASSLKQIKSTLRAKAGSGGGKCKAELSEHWRNSKHRPRTFPFASLVTCTEQSIAGHLSEFCMLNNPGHQVYCRWGTASGEREYPELRLQRDWALDSSEQKIVILWLYILQESYSMYDMIIYIHISI